MASGGPETTVKGGAEGENVTKALEELKKPHEPQIN